MDANRKLPAVPALVRRRGPMDTLLAEADRALAVLSGSATAGRPYPARKMQVTLSDAQRRASAGMMRVNHVGEVCAQALYRGQAVACKDAPTRELLRHAASEEVDHLAWCDRRLKELNSRPSLLNPLWYAGSFGLGVLAGYAGVPRNLGFMAETERQVETHLDGHLKRLAVEDTASRAVVQQMKEDEIAHRLSAERAGGRAMPFPIKTLMRGMSKIMTGTAYHV